MKIYKMKNYEFWYDKNTRCWWAAKYDKNHNQIGDAFHAYTKEEIKNEIRRTK